MHFVYAYNNASQSLQELRGFFGNTMRVIRHRNSAFKGSPDKVVINWGSSYLPPEVKLCQVINNNEAVKLAKNKIDTFKALDGKVNLPDWTEDPDVAEGWFKDGLVVLARSLVEGRGGEGITIFDPVAEPEDEICNERFKLFTKYVPKIYEFRAHVFRDNPFLVQKKVLPNGKGAYPRIRSHDNGFVFSANNVPIQDDALRQAVSAVAGLGLDFGAVDIIYNRHRDKSYVLEVNTAPGITNSSVVSYAQTLFGLDMKAPLPQPQPRRARRNPMFVEPVPAAAHFAWAAPDPAAEELVPDMNIIDDVDFDDGFVDIDDEEA